MNICPAPSIITNSAFGFLGDRISEFSYYITLSALPAITNADVLEREQREFNIQMKSDHGKKGFVFVSMMTFPLDMAILNTEFRWKI
jgi:hypothetical protein